MSRILVATLGSAGDVYPFLAIARALARQGEPVLFMSSEPHRAAVEAEGVAFAPIISAHDHHRTASHPDLWHPVRGFGVLWRHLAVRSIETVHQLIRDEVQASDQSVRVLASPLVLGARLAADLLPIRLVTAHTAPSGLRHLGDPLFIGSWQVPAWWPDAWRQWAWRALDLWKLQPMALPAINKWRLQHGLAALNEPIFARWIHSPQHVIGLYPAWFGTEASDSPVPVQCVGFPLFQPSAPAMPDPTLSEWLHGIKARPRLVVYAGSTSALQTQDFVHCAQALEQQGWPVLLIEPGSEPHSFGTDGLVRPWVDLRMVLMHCDGWIHHGGIGACAEGMHANVRAWTRPSAYDQFDNSARMAHRLGLPLRDVMLTRRQCVSGQLPGLNSLSRRPVAADAPLVSAGSLTIERIMAVMRRA